VCEAAPATLTVIATGTEPLAYQWRKEGVDIPGATAASYAIGAAAATDAGSYDVVVTNACGMATSTAATLIVGGAIAITSHPASQSACAGEAVTLSVTAVATEPVSYQWRKDGQDLAGMTAPTLAFSPAGVSDSGSYDVVVTDLCGTLASDAAVLTVTGPAILSLTPAAIAPMTEGAPDVTVDVGGSCFLPTSVVYANGAALPTTFLSPSALSCALPASIAQCRIFGALCINVQNTPDDVSNSVALPVGSGTNQGTIRRHPLAPAPGETFFLVIEGGPPFAVFSLLADLGNVTPVPAFPDPVSDMVLAVTFLTGSAGPFIPVLDGLGLFGPGLGVALDGNGSFSFGPIVLPDPGLGIVATLQAVCFDPSSPIGLRLTWARVPENF
jgi:hypothetical protein